MSVNVQLDYIIANTILWTKLPIPHDSHSLSL